MDEWYKNSKKRKAYIMKALQNLYGDVVKHQDTDANSQNSLSVTRSSATLGIGAKKGKKRRYVESQHQQALVAWMRRKGLRFTKIHNEGAMTRIQGHRLNQEGREKHMPDLFLCHVGRKKGVLCYGGFFIEMKSPGKTPNEGQLAMLQDLRTRGYRAEWYDDWEVAKAAICEYLGQQL